MNTRDPISRLRDAIDKDAVESFEGVTRDRYSVYVPEMYPDGDHPVVLLVKRHQAWWFTDEGNTLMRRGAGTIEMSLRLERIYCCDFVYDLKMFVKALLMVDTSRTKV